MNRIAAIVLLAACSAPAVAGDVYLLGSIGQANHRINKADADDALVTAGATNVSSSIDDSDSAFKLQLGYQLTNNFAVEGGYVNLGKSKYAATYTGGAADATIKVSGWDIAAVGILPINDAFSAFAKIGTINATVEGNVAASGPGGAASVTASATKWKAFYGLGASYKINKQFAVRAEYELFKKLGDKNKTGEGDVSLMSVGAVVKF